MFFFAELISFICNSKKKEETNKDVEESIESVRTPEGSITFYDGIVHMFQTTVGSGILAIPAAYSHAGYVGSVLGTVFVLTITNNCCLTLADCQREQKKRRPDMVPTYQGTVQAAFIGGPKSFQWLSPIFVALTSLFIVLGQIGGNCICLIFIASNFKAAVYPYLEIDLRYIVLIVCVPLLAVNMLTNLKKLTFVSGFGNLVLILSIAVVIGYIFREPVTLDGMKAFGSYSELPKFFGTLFFSSPAVTVILPLKNEMKKENKIFGPCGVINFTAYLYGSLYIVFGLLGYMKYGENAAASITLNLPQREIIGQVVQGMLALTVLTGTAIHNYIVVTVVWDNYLDKIVIRHRMLTQYLLKLSIIAITLVVALIVPNLELLLSVVGVVTQCTLNTSIPCIVHILTYYKQPSFRAYVKKFWLDVIALLFTLTVIIFGFMYTFIK